MPDIEAALVTFLADLAWTVTVTPGDLPVKIADHGGVIRCRRIGGGGDRDNDIPTVSIQVFAAPDADHPRAAHDLAAQVEDRFVSVLNDGPAWVDGVTIEEPDKQSGPVELPYPDPTIRVVETIYRITSRR